MIDNQPPLAIIGMACFLPKASNLNEFWNLLITHQSGISVVPGSRLDYDLYFNPQKGVCGRTYINQGGLLDYPPFDQSVCEYPTNVMNYIEIGHLLMTQVAAQACRHARLNPFDIPLKNTGVYIGNNQAGHLAGNLTYSAIVEEAAQYLKKLDIFHHVVGKQAQKVIDEVVSEIRKQLPQYGRNGFPTVGYHVTANAVSDALHLNGPSFVLDAACSSSLKALSLAAQDIQLGNVDMAIVGGASFFTTDSLLLFSAAQSGSAKGCFPFSEKADGLISAEGYVAIVVKSLDRALCDGDPIQAIIPGIGVSSDGRAKSLWAPRKEGQIKAICRAYRNDAEFQRLDYIEAHATSTALGDQTELDAMEKVFQGQLGERKIPIGGVKANIGHALEAAGLAGLIKTVLVLQNELVPKQINSTPLNSRINWEALPFFVPQENTPIPKRADGLPRRAAVNSFGIGGLNVHVVLEEYCQELTVYRNVAKRTEPAAMPKTAPQKVEPIAVVGIGAVFPGARTAAAFEQLLFSNTDPSSKAAERTGSESGTPQYGGFIRDFEYNWKLHRIAPKHLVSADPLQFLILDSVDAALQDSGYIGENNKVLPTETTGVIVGSTFDTDFAVDLCMGFRLPHFQKELRTVLSRHGIVDEERVQEILDQYASVLLKQMPAILDETGSFTPSTLSSRITKSYDFMGGAGTIDSGNTVGLAALAQAVNSLRTGMCDLMVCTVGTRSMGIQTFTRMALAHQLAEQNNRNPLDAESTGQIPGEGAGTLILKRLSDAERDGDEIYCLIHGVGAGFDADPKIAFTQAMERAWNVTDRSKDDVYLVEGSAAPSPIVPQELVALNKFYGSSLSNLPHSAPPSPHSGGLLFDRADVQIGQTFGASSMASLLKANYELQQLKMPKSFGLKTPRSEFDGLTGISVPKAPTSLPVNVPQNGETPKILAVVSSWDPCGSAYHAILERGTKTPLPRLEQRSEQPRCVVPSQAVPVKAQWKIVRLDAASQSDLMKRIDETIPSVEIAYKNACRNEETDSVKFRAENPYRLAVVAADPEDLAKKLTLAKKFGFDSQDTCLAQKGIFVGKVSQKRKVAFLFSGQGSQYAQMLKSLVESFEPAQAALEQIDQDLRFLGLPTFESLAWNEPEQLGQDVFRTQLSLLCADTILSRSLAAFGITPDVVSGHSFGEFPALVASNVWTFREGAKATKLRCDAIVNCQNADGVMLSTNWDEHRSNEASRQINGSVFVANINAPDQTVLGGTRQAVAELEQYIKSHGGIAKTIPVPRPFHTKLMEEVREPLYTALKSVETRSPSIPLYSSVDNSYTADPEKIQRNLADQMIQPVRYVELIRRLIDDGVNLLIECGPNQILTRLHRKITEGQSVTIISSDNKQENGLFQLLCVKACFDLWNGESSTKSTKPVSRNLVEWGTQYRETIRGLSQRLADAGGSAASAVELTANDKNAAGEIAQGAGLLPICLEALLRNAGGLNAFQNALEPNISETKIFQPISEQEFGHWRREIGGKPPVEVKGCDYSRFTLRMMKKALEPNDRKPITWNGRTLILGQNVAAKSLAEKIRQNGGEPVLLPLDGNREDILNEIDRLWQQSPLPHLFLMTAHDPDANTDLSESGWNNRRERGVLLPYFVTQRWYQLLSRDKMLAKGTLFGSTVLGGDFGFSQQNIRSVEGGAISGLIKSLDLEAGFPTNFAFVAKTIDFSESSEWCADAILAELAAKIPYETEIGYIGKERFLVRPIIQKVNESEAASAIPTGNWIVTGGGRGITAFVAEGLARKYHLTLHLFGSSPEPQVDTSWYKLNEMEKEEFKRQLQMKAEQNGENPLDARKRFERSLELDGSLQKMRQAGMTVNYYQCDVSDRKQVQQTLDEVRRRSGEINGILHGAGIEVSCRMEAKNPATVEKTFAVKCDGAAILMDLTKNDPIRYFIGFGSIAGRMGSIGQTDYSMSNDTLAKLCDWYQGTRPDCHVTCFHWGPWGEIGMAVTPEMQNNLILSTMQLLKPEEGLRHFMNELTTTNRTTETLLIDWAHYKLYYPDSEIESQTEQVVETKSKKEAEALPQTSVVKPAPKESPKSIMESVTKSVGSPSPICRKIIRWIDASLVVSEKELSFENVVMVLGKNKDADHLTATLTGYGVHTVQIESSEDEHFLMKKMDEIWNEQGPISHLFVMTGRDTEALRLSDPAVWKQRRKSGLFAPFYLFRHWLRKLTEAKMLDQAVLVAATAMNGDFGTESGSPALESAGISGLLKTIHLEHGGANRDGMTVRIVDFAVDTPPEQITSSLFFELTTNGFDIETAYVNGQRRVPRLINSTAVVAENTGTKIERGSTWVITGGARGITAEVAKALGKRFGLKLRLLGSSPIDAVDPSFYSLSEDELKARKRIVVKQALADGKSPEKEWGRIANALEMQRNLQMMKESGLDVVYYQCDVTNPQQITVVLSDIVQKDGPIYGIVHGAGIDGNPTTIRNMPDSQFDVADRLIGIKVDAVLEILRQIDLNSLRYFVGFGSISGRFGSANASSYCSGNDMLCKIMGQLRSEQPNCRAVGIHWHAWGDIGMMMRPVSYGSVKILKMQLMPPQQGVEFLIRELEAGLPENEIVVTDSQYYSLFYSDEMLIDDSVKCSPKITATKNHTLFALKKNEIKSGTKTGASRLPLIDVFSRATVIEGIGECTFQPETDPFLIDHRFRKRPLLPAVISMEAMLETVSNFFPNKKIVALHDLKLFEGLSFPNEKSVSVRVHAELAENLVACRLLAPFCNSHGKILDPERTYSTGIVEIADALPSLTGSIPKAPQGQWHKITYVDSNSLMYHGPVFQQSLEALFSENHGVWDKIVANPLADFAGSRGSKGWILHPGTVDACLYICGVCVWLSGNGAIGLPKSVQLLKINRRPNDGEKCEAHILFKHGNEKETFFDVTCCGENGEPLFLLENYCCQTVPSSVKKLAKTS